jgi:hypothetical protein
MSTIEQSIDVEAPISSAGFESRPGESGAWRGEVPREG